MTFNHADLSLNKQVIRLFWRHAAKYPALHYGRILTVPLAMMFNKFLPALITAGILDRLSRGDFVRGDVWGSFGPNIVMVIGFAALGGIAIWRVNDYLNWTLESRVIKDLDQRIFNKLMSMSADFHANNFGGSLVSQTNKLTSAYIRIADTSLYQVSTLFWSLTFTSVLLWSRAPAFVVLLNVFSWLYIAAAVLITGRVRYFTRNEATISTHQTGQLADSITNILAVKSFATSDVERKRYASTTEKTRLASMQTMWASFKTQHVFGSISAVINATAIIMAVTSVVVYDANIATVFLVFSYTYDIRERLWEFANNALRTYNRAFGDAQAMAEILMLEPGIKDPATPQQPRISKGKIVFKDVDFTHDASDQDALFVKLNLALRSGEKVGLVGHSGSGKTTLAKLLLRFSDLDGGEILIDGQNIARITQDDLRRHITYVPQEPLLFHRTIRENIAYGKPGSTDEEITAVARKAHAAEFIEKLPKGYDTLVGERGVKLSGGQRQRIAIARAMLKDAPILVLDEATSALDSESEQLIQDALWKLMKDHTALIIAHRLSTVQKMDRIIVLDDGVIIEEGTHKQLLRKKGVYASLWARQSGGFLED